MWGDIFSSKQTIRSLVKRLRGLLLLPPTLYTRIMSSLSWFIHSLCTCKIPISLFFPFFFCCLFLSGPFLVIYPEPCRVYLYSADLQARLITPRSLINSFRWSCLAFPSATSWLPLQTCLPLKRFLLCWIARCTEFPCNLTGRMWLRYCRNS